MSITRSIGSLLAVLTLVVASRLPDSAAMAGVRYLAFGYMAVDFLLRARTGYLRRRPHWTPASWRRYLVACSVPIGAILIMVGMMAAVEWKLPIVGAARSSLRGLWVAGIVIFMTVGAIGLGVALEWLTGGEASRQFAWPKWLGGQRDEAA